MLNALILLHALTLAPQSEPPIDPPLPSSVVALSETGRFRTSRTFDDTLDFYEKLFHASGGVRWRSIVNLPGIKAKHLESLRKKTRWEGINIYEYKGDVRLFVVMRPGQKFEGESKQKTK